MALTNDQLYNNIQAQLEDFTMDTEIFVNELKDQATADPFTVFRAPTSGSSYTILTGAGSNFFEALANEPVRPDGLDYVSPVDPGPAPTGFTLTDVVLPTIPNFADVAPTLVFPTVPSVVLPSAPTEPSIASVLTPAKPVVTLPSVPVLNSISIPDAPTISIPTFTEAFPEVPDLLLLTDTFAFSEEEYQNDLLDRIEEVLLSDLDNGAFGITTADEEAVYSRGLDREIRTSQAREREITDTFAQRGFRAPTGLLVELHATNIQESLERVSALNREVVINRAELYRRAREFAITQGLSLNELLIRHFGFVQERALNAARFGAEFAVTVLDVQIRRHNLKLASFQAFASAYEVQVRALLTQVEIFKAQVEAASVEQDINESVVNVYEAQIRAANTLVSLFSTELEAAQVQVQIESLKLEQYKTRTEAFIAQIRAKSEELDLYESQIRAEGLKQDSYRSQVQAFGTRVDAAKAEAEIQLAKLQGDIRSAELVLEGYRTNVRKYATDIDAETARISSLANIYGADTDVFRAIISGWEGLSRVDIASSESLTREMQEEERLALAELGYRVDELIKQKELRLEATKAGADVFATVLAAIGNSAQAIGVNEQDVAAT